MLLFNFASSKRVLSMTTFIHKFEGGKRWSVAVIDLRTKNEETTIEL